MVANCGNLHGCRQALRSALHDCCGAGLGVRAGSALGLELSRLSVRGRIPVCRIGRIGRRPWPRFPFWAMLRRWRWQRVSGLPRGGRAAVPSTEGAGASEERDLAAWGRAHGFASISARASAGVHLGLHFSMVFRIRGWPCCGHRSGLLHALPPERSPSTHHLQHL